VRRLIGAGGGRVSRNISRYIGEPGAIHGPTSTAALRYIDREESGQEHDPERPQASGVHRVASPRISGSSFQKAREGSGVQ
jgi:hypothetical protein